MPSLKNHARVVRQAAAIAGRRTRFGIDGVRGLILDCLPTGERSWYVRYQVGHGDTRKERFYRLGSANIGADDYLTLGQAIDRASDVRVDAKKHRRDRFAEERPTGTTFDDLFSDWLEHHGKVKKKSWREDEALYSRHIKARLGSRVAADLKRRDVIETLDSIARKVSGIQANRCQAIISAAFNWAVAEDRLEGNPAHGVRKRGKENQRARVLTDKQLCAFWHALTDSHKDAAIKLLLLLGQRRGEVRLASTNELTADAWSLPNTRTKNNGLPHIVPLTPYARSLFGDGFCISAAVLSHRVCDLVRGLGIEDFRLHDLRHQAATGMAALGISREIRERVQNQITGRRQTVGARYDQHEYLAEKRDALERWERELLRIVS
jgi:integrase